MNKPILILDLDETLIHGTEFRLDRFPDFMVGPYLIYQRPHLSDFFAQVPNLRTVEKRGDLTSPVEAPKLNPHSIKFKPAQWVLVHTYSLAGLSPSGHYVFPLNWPAFRFPFR